MINFTVGPVQTNDIICQIGSEQIPYFRTQEFSELMFENERLMKKFTNAEDKSRVVFLTASGTGAMEAAVINFFSKDDRLLVINGGSFGDRFVKLCKIHELSYSEIKLDVGKTLKREKLYEYDGKGYTGLLVNINETSTGVLYDIDMIGEFCKNNNMFLIADAISSFLADPLDMQKCNIDVIITGSQKALACPPGVSVIVLSNRAVSRVADREVKTLYFNIKDMLNDGLRGQTPFTPAVGIMRQINMRLNQIEQLGGIEYESDRIKTLAKDFRDRIKDLPLEIISDNLPNGVTALHPKYGSANEIFLHLKDEYDIWICPNGGDLKERVFRVGHLGNLTIDDNIFLVNALTDLHKRGIL